jgi:hypothetical protein
MMDNLFEIRFQRRITMLHANRFRFGLALGLMALFVACTGSPSVQDAPEAYAGTDQGWVAPDQTANAEVSLSAIQIDYRSPSQDLTSFKPDSASNGFGPYETNASNGESNANDGKPLTINGTRYATGLGVHAFSALEYPIAKQCRTFTATVGLDDEIDTQSKYGSVVFQVFTDNLKVFDSGVMRGTTPAKTVSVNVKGTQRLRLVVTDAGDNKYYDHADWAIPTLTCSPDDLLAGKTSIIKAGINYLSDLAPRGFFNGYGPVEFDMSNGEQFAGDGRTISLNGQKYSKGLGVHAYGFLSYATNGKCSSLKADIGLDDEVDDKSYKPIVQFTVQSNTNFLYGSGPMTVNDKKSIDIALGSSVNYVNIEVIVQDAQSPTEFRFAHADWANAHFVCAP